MRFEQKIGRSFPLPFGRGSRRCSYGGNAGGGRSPYAAVGGFLRMVGVTNRSSSPIVSFLLLALKKKFTNGMYISPGHPELVRPVFCWSSPPMTAVSPSLTMSTVLAWRLLIDVKPLNVAPGSLSVTLSFI